MKRHLVFAVMLASCSKPPSKTDAKASTPIEPGTMIPAYAALTLDGDTVRVGGAQSPTVLNVWATWCNSCQEEMAALDSLRTRYASQGLRVIAVSVDNGDVDKVRRFAESNHLGMTVAHDPASTVNQTYEVVGVPTTFIIGRDGRLLWRHTGNVTEVMPEARATIEKALAQ